MVLMSEDSSLKTEDLKSGGGSNPDSLSSDSGVSNCSKEGSKGERIPQEEKEKKKERDNIFDKFSNRSGRRHTDFFGDDPFFSERDKLFGKSRFANRPRLSEKFWGKGKGSSIFDNDKFVDDLRKRFDEEKKMFFDGESDPFSASFRGRSSSPVGGGAGRAGFPGFEDLRSGARARFDEFANRHPTMFSTMRNQPAWNFDDNFGHHHHHGFDGFPRDRHNSGSSGGGSGASTSSTGEERVIPIQIIRDDPPKSQQAKEKSPAPPQVDVTPRVIKEKTPPPQQQQQQPNGPQRCNTEPSHPIVLEDNRAARAQSAPPVQNGTSPKVESTNGKPQPTQMGGNSSKTPKADKQQGPAPSANGARSIPIIVEGRKGAAAASASPNGNCNSGGQSPPQPKVSRPAERSPTPPSKKPTPIRDPLAQVNAVSEEVKELEKQVDDFKGTSREDREYLVLDEMLTRCLIKLDVVETEGRDDVRTARKECIKYIQSCISKLEKKTPLPPQPEEKNECTDLALMETSQDSKAGGGDSEQMDTTTLSQLSQPPTTQGGKPIPPPKPTSKIENADQKMDVDPSSSNNAIEGCTNEATGTQKSGDGNSNGDGGDKANVVASDQQPVNA